MMLLVHLGQLMLVLLVLLMVMLLLDRGWGLSMLNCGRWLSMLVHVRNVMCHRSVMLRRLLLLLNRRSSYHGRSEKAWVGGRRS
jgi:hypothetical protein